MSIEGRDATLTFGRDYQLPWKRGIGGESRKIWDANGRLVCTMETSADSTFLVDAVNGHTKSRRRLGKVRELVERILEGEHHGRVKVVAEKTLGLVNDG